MGGVDVGVGVGATMAGARGSVGDGTVVRVGDGVGRVGVLVGERTAG
jgi:hypothetical protein